MNTMTLRRLISEKGFDYADPEITELNFPFTENLGEDYKLFRFDRDFSYGDIIKEMKKGGYFACNIYELLSWKDWNNKDLVISLGSICRINDQRYAGQLYTPVLVSDNYEHNLCLSGCSNYGWSPFYRFLGCKRNVDEQQQIIKDNSLTLSNFTKELKTLISKYD